VENEFSGYKDHMMTKEHMNTPGKILKTALISGCIAMAAMAPAVAGGNGWGQGMYHSGGTPVRSESNQSGSNDSQAHAWGGGQRSGNGNNNSDHGSWSGGRAHEMGMRSNENGGIPTHNITTTNGMGGSYGHNSNGAGRYNGGGVSNQHQNMNP
jgi:hypothetical protein